ncbi:hypothetical protein ACFLY6_01050 [Candidatus Dependentiae bacterium]
MRYAKVLLIDGWREPLWYKIPEVFCGKVFVDSIVLVPLRKQTKHAVVEKVSLGVPKNVKFLLRFSLTNDAE